VDRCDDVVGRLDGEEFAMPLVHPDNSDAEANVDGVIARLRSAVARVDPPTT
jgi:PleD family two-component response regulator